MTKEDYVYSRIGMALVSTQKVEFLTSSLLEFLTEYDKDVYGITTAEFLTQSAKSSKAIKTLGAVFKLLKLNPYLVIEDELNEYLRKRNLFVHRFHIEFLKDQSDKTTKKAIDFCYDFGRHSDRVESFFKGFLYLLALKHVQEHDQMHAEFKGWKKDYDYFLKSLEHKELKNIH